MTIQRLDHVSVVVNDLEAAKAFFVDLGLEVDGEAPVEGRSVDRVNGIDGIRADIAMMRTPDTLGLPSIMFAPMTSMPLSPACDAPARNSRPATHQNDPSCGPEFDRKEMTMQPNEITEVLSRPMSQELLARDITRLAYVAKDGTPRNVPIAFTWNGSEIVMCTTKNAPKLPALRNNPTVALTIDTEVHPPKILLIRGRAELDFVDDIPEEYLRATSTYQMTPEQRVEWEAEVRSLYHDGMVRIVVNPSWAKLIDFETTLPSAVEELIRRREQRQHG